MRSTCEYKAAIGEYNKKLLVAGLVAYGLFIAGLWAIALLLSLLRSQLATIVDHVKSSPFLQVVAPVICFGLVSLPVLAFLFLAVGRIRRSSNLHCDACGVELFTTNSQYYLRLLSTCPNCGNQVISDSTFTPDSAYFERHSQQHSQHLRFATVAVAISLPVMYAILIWGNHYSAFPNADWPMIAGFPVFFAATILGPFYFATTTSLARLHRAKIAWQHANNIECTDQGT